jgi:hypothetical protein
MSSAAIGGTHAQAQIDTHYHTITHTITHYHTHTITHTLSHTHYHTHTITHTHTRAHTPCLFSVCVGDGDELVGTLSGC